MKLCVSTLIPSEEGGQYLLSKQCPRGWWMPFGDVLKSELIKTAAERVASEVSILLTMKKSCVEIIK